MKEQLNSIHIALAFDKNFVTTFYVLITSIFLNNKENKIIIHTIATGVDDLEKKRITEYVELNNGEIYFYDITKIFKIEELDFPCLESTAFTIAIFYRLFFPKIVPKHIKKLLYMDVDILVLDNLMELYSTDISPFPVGAAKESNVSDIAKNHALIEKTGVTADNSFNSGVLLIDIQKWNQEGILENTLQFMSDNQDILKYPDQDGLNYALKNNWYRLSEQYNFCHADIPVELSKKEILKNKITILHYTGSKPWHFTNSARLRHFYYYYLKKTPYISNKKYSDFDWTKSSFNKYIYIRVLEFYLDNNLIRNVWKRIKSLKMKPSFEKVT